MLRLHLQPKLKRKLVIIVLLIGDVAAFVNSNIDSTVHVNNAIFPFMFLLRFSTVLSSKVMYVLPSDLSFIVK